MAMELTQRLAIFGLTFVCAICLQGCNVHVPRHEIGNWEAEKNYWVKYQFTPPGQDGIEKRPMLNSCSDPELPPTMVCSGHGRCKDWHDGEIGEAPGLQRLSFCDCDPNWADPECGTPRKSQQTAYFLSIFFGVLGADQFYLGFFWKGIAKLITLGGLGFYWLYDICKIGSHPPSTNGSFRVSGDLPHYAFVLSSIIIMLTLGFFVAIRSIQTNRIKKAHELMLMRLERQQEEDQFKEQGIEDEDDTPAEQPGIPEPPYSMAQVPLKTGASAFTGYGSTLPRFAAPTAGPVYASRSGSFKPAVTMPPAPVITTPTPVASPPVASTLPPRVMAPAPVASTLSPRGMSFTNSAPVLPVVQGMAPVTTALTAPAVRPVSSAIL